MYEQVSFVITTIVYNTALALFLGLFICKQRPCLKVVTVALVGRVAGAILDGPVSGHTSLRLKKHICCIVNLFSLYAINLHFES